MGSAGAANGEFHEKRGKNIPQEPLFSPDWQQDCRILSWQKLTPHRHTGQANETMDTQSVRQTEMTEWVIGRSRCGDGVLPVLRGLTLCRYLWKNSKIQTFHIPTLVLSLLGITFSGQQKETPTVAKQRSICGLPPDLCWGLLQIRRHFHAAFIQELQLSEEQSKLPQVLLQLSKAILVHCLALGHTIRKLNQKHKTFLMS